jgi:uncharacterized protein YwqG
MRTLDDMLKPLVSRASALRVQKASAPLSRIASKFGGVPYLESGEAWPQCQTCKRPLSFICQLDLRETSHPARDRIPFFTFFYCWNCFPGGPPGGEQGEWVVRKYANPGESKAVAIQPPGQVEHASECSVSFSECLSLPDWDGADLWCPDAGDLCCEVNNEAPWEEYRAAVERIPGEQEIQSRVGGYPHWIQGEATPDKAEFLAQIDSKHDAGIMWGDVGCVYLFLSKGSEPRVSLNLQCC